MLKLVVVGVSGHGSVVAVAGDDNSTLSGGDRLLDAMVLGTDTALNATGLDELVSVGVLADTTDRRGERILVEEGASGDLAIGILILILILGTYCGCTLELQFWAAPPAT